MLSTSSLRTVTWIRANDIYSIKDEWMPIFLSTELALSGMSTNAIILRTSKQKQMRQAPEYMAIEDCNILLTNT